MIAEAIATLAEWSLLDTWIVVIAAVAAMACSVPGVFLLVRRQSMLGDTLSHTSLPGIAVGFLVSIWLREQGWLSDEAYENSRHFIAALGAMAAGVLAAVLTELIQKAGRVEASAALGVVFTSLFAVGLLLVRLFADRVDLDPDCVLYGSLEASATDMFGQTEIPRAVVINGSMLLANLLLVAVFFKELRLCAFDPTLATTQGIPATALHYALTATTAATLVAAFESVGSILVIAMLIVPAATARLLTDRLWKMVALGLLIASLGAVLGHTAAITLPTMALRPLGFALAVDASSAGMTAVAAGSLFCLALFFSPRYGLLSRVWHRYWLSLQVAADDLLGLLYRRQERTHGLVAQADLAPVSRWQRVALAWLIRKKEVEQLAEGWRLTDRGRRHAEQLVRSHRLWESYMAKHFGLPGDHLHQTAERVEHFIDREMRAEMAAELAASVDPHGREIPSEPSAKSPE